jgi:hypothetical protein
VKSLQKFFSILFWPFVWLYKLLFGPGGITFSSPTSGQCVTWDASGNVTIPVAFNGMLAGGFTYVITVFRQGPPMTQINGDYAFGANLVIPQADHGSPAQCQNIVLSLIEIDNSVTPPRRRTMCGVTVKLCPTCP